MTHVEPLGGSAQAPAPGAHDAQLANQLRAAAMEGDEARVTALLSELLRWQGLSRGQRIALQLAALLNLLHSLRAVTLSDDLTGLYNRRGFMQFGTRLLEVAAREQRIVHLVGFGVDHLMRSGCATDRPAGDVLLRQMGNLLRDLFPNYGIYEVLGRVSAGEFAALTTSAEYASRSAVLLRTRRPQLRGGDIPVTSLSIGVAHFDPQCPASLEELMEGIRRQMQEGKRMTQIASSGPTPRPG